MGRDKDYCGEKLPARHALFLPAQNRLLAVVEKILFKTLLAWASLCTLEVSDYSVNLSAMCLYSEFASSISV
jgi:hypothetical protein